MGWGGDVNGWGEEEVRDGEGGKGRGGGKGWGGGK